jgi:hypothetical protein
MSESRDQAPAGTVRVQAAVPLAELLKQVAPTPPPVPEAVRELGGRSDGPEPTRYGDWEKNGRCIDF